MLREYWTDYNPSDIMPSSHAHTLTKFYDQEALRLIDDVTFRLMWYRFHTMINMIAGSNLTVLDIGAGDGDVVFTLSQRGHSCIVMDISPVRLKKYEEKATQLSVKQVLGNVEEHIPLPDASIDVVLCGEVIEHVPNNDKALDEIHRVLKPHGQFIVSVPYKETLKMAKCPDCGKVFEINGHLHTYEVNNLRALLKRHYFVPLRLHIGHTKISREMWKRWNSSLSLHFCHIIDTLTYLPFRASDTWIMVKGTKQQ